MQIVQGIFTLYKKENWELLLMQYIEGCSSKPFVWGKHDCCTFSIGAVHLITGVDPLRGIKLGNYKTRKGAFKVLSDAFGGNLKKAMATVFGKPVKPHLISRGDVVYYLDKKTGACMGICGGRDCYFVGESKGQNGIVTIPTAEVMWGFKI